MTKYTKLETLKILLVQWQRSHGLAEAATVCEFLSDNLDTRDIDPEPAKDYLMDAANETIDKIRDSIPEPSTMEEYHS